MVNNVGRLRRQDGGDSQSKLKEGGIERYEREKVSLPIQLCLEESLRDCSAAVVVGLSRGP